jgi:uncharacterized protein (DUF427 family)
MAMHRDVPGPGQESVWDYPRPPRLERSSKEIRVLYNGQLIARTGSAYRVLETSHTPTWYIPPSDIHKEFLRPSTKASHCEWKGLASYWTVRVGSRTAENAAWCYESPTAGFAGIAGYLAFFPNHFDCYVDGESVQAQPGDFYGGWITHDVVGPVKGKSGSSHW